MNAHPAPRVEDAPPRRPQQQTEHPATSALPAIEREDALDPLVARKINGERLALAGWGTAVLMQFMHPLVAAGIHEHSVVVEDPRAWLRRLTSTVRAMLALNFGTPEEAAAAVAAINHIHTRVHGQLDAEVGRFPAGTPYSAEYPDLLLWVNCTLLYALPRAYTLFVGPLTRAEKDRLCLESRPMGIALGIPPERLPTSMAQVEAMVAEMIATGTLTLGPPGRALARQLFRPPWPRPLLALLPILQLPMVAMLPPAIRAAHGFRWERRHRLILALIVGVVRALLPLAPSRLRYWPQARRAS